MNDKNSKPPRIRMTTDYDIFQEITGNRMIDRRYLRRLVESIQKNNLLPWNPILVDQNMGVIDGQHRLQAAIELEIPIFYTVAPNTTFADVTRLNATMQKWSMVEYTNAWAKRGKQAYIKVLEFAKKWKVTVPTAIAMLSADGIRQDLRAPFFAFKAGDFEPVDEKLAAELAGLWQQINPYVEARAHFNRDYLKAIYTLFINEDIDLQRFLDQLKNQGEKLSMRGTRIDWLRAFEDVYNFKLKSSVRIY